MPRNNKNDSQTENAATDAVVEPTADQTETVTETPVMVVLLRNAVGNGKRKASTPIGPFPSLQAARAAIRADIRPDDVARIFPLHPTETVTELSMKDIL